MSSMTSPQRAAQIREVRQLLSLRKIREEAASRVRQACLLAVDAANAEVRTQQARIEHTQERRGHMVRWMHADSALRTVRWSPYAHAAMDRLRQDHERAHDALLVAHRRLAIAEANAQEARQHHSVACARVQVMEGLLKRLLAAQAGEEDRRLELEATPARTLHLSACSMGWTPA